MLKRKVYQELLKWKEKVSDFVHENGAEVLYLPWYDPFLHAGKKAGKTGL